MALAHRDRGFAYRCRRWGLRGRERLAELTVPADINARSCGGRCLLFDPHDRLLHLDTASTQFAAR
nr:hypothetical protein [uncultured Caldimonas sp.]